MGPPESRVGRLRAGNAAQYRAEHAGHHGWLRVGEHGFCLARIEPEAVTMRALIDLHAVPLATDQVVAALGALHVMGAALGVDRGAVHCLALLAEQLGVTPGEVLVLVLARLVGHRSQGAESGLSFRLSRPGVMCGCVATGEDDWRL